MTTPLDKLTVYKELEPYLSNPQYRVFDHGSALGVGERHPTYSFLLLDTTQTYLMVESEWYRPLILDFVMAFDWRFSDGKVLQAIMEDDAVSRYRKLRLLT